MAVDMEAATQPTIQDTSTAAATAMATVVEDRYHDRPRGYTGDARVNSSYSGAYQPNRRHEIRGGNTDRHGVGVGEVGGTSYESIGLPIVDPRIQQQWSGYEAALDVPDDQLTETFAICARPNFGQAGKTTALQANYFVGWCCV